MKSRKHSNVCSTVVNSMIWEQKTSRLRGKFNRRAICRGKSSLRCRRVGIVFSSFKTYLRRRILVQGKLFYGGLYRRLNPAPLGLKALNGELVFSRHKMIHRERDVLARIRSRYK